MNIFSLFSKPKLITHRQRHEMRMKALRAEGVRKYHKEHKGMRKVPCFEFGRLSGYLYLPKKRGFIAAGDIAKGGEQ